LLVIREPHPTIFYKMIYWMSKYKIFYLGFLKPNLENVVMEKAFVTKFFTDWSPFYPNLIAAHGFKIIKDRAFLVDHITSCRKLNPMYERDSAI